MVSTLDILKKEKELVDEINRYDMYIEITKTQLEKISKYASDCEACKRDIDHLKSMINEYQLKKGELLAKLDEVCIELREHLKNCSLGIYKF